MSNARNLANLLGTKTKVKDVDVDGTELILDADGDTSIEASSDDTIVIDTGGSERARIDGSGNLFVSATATSGFQSSSSESGSIIYGAGGIASNSASNDVTAVFNRLGNDGSIIQLKKDGSTVGNIETSGGNLIVQGSTATGKTGIKFGGAEFIPQDNGNSDNGVDLGMSSARFKDLYLGGGIYVGGTGSANYLDDYEEGTWTPAFVGATNSPGLHNNVGRYTRIGRLVVVQFFQQTSGSPAPTFSNNSAAFQISGVPFSVQGHGYTGSQGSMNAQAFHYNGSNNTQSTQADFVSPNITGSDLLEFQVTDSGSTRGVVNNTGAKASPYVIEVTISYFTDA